MMTLKRINKMETRKSVLTRMAFMLMLATAFAVAMPTNVSAATITVPDDYPTIQQAVNAANAGDTVYVRAGTYYEHLSIGKSLTLQGENRDTTIIDGSGTGNVIYVTADKVNFSGFTVHNGNVGIRLQSSNHDTVSNNIISNHTTGVVLHGGSSYNLIIDCSLTNCTGGINLWAGCNNNTYENCTASYCSFVGFHVGWGRYNIVKNCKAWNCGYGIELDSCYFTTVEKCDVWSNNTGILIYSWGPARYNIIKDCNAYSNGTGINATYGGGGQGGYNNIYHNNLMNNTQYQAKDHQYYPNQWDDGYPSGGNYWGDYTGVDNYSGVNQDQPGSDGIGDTPYMIPGTANNRDNYPLVRVIYVEIDIKPGSDPNPINPGSKGLVPVAILSSEEFDATQVDPTSVVLAGAGVAVRGKNKSMAHEEDVNGDGLTDLVVQVETQSFGDLGNGGMVKLTGETYGGQAIAGEDEIVIVPPE